MTKNKSTHYYNYNNKKESQSPSIGFYNALLSDRTHFWAVGQKNEFGYGFGLKTSAPLVG